MRIVELKPIKETTEDFDQLEERMVSLFRKEIYEPLIEEMGQPDDTLRLENSIEDLEEAIRKGRIHFHRGRFKGKFSASSSRELKKLGAKWNRRESSFDIPARALPISVRSAISASESRFVRILEAISRKLEQILPEEIAEKLKASDLFDRTLWKTNDKMKKSVEGITIIPKLTDQQRKKIADEYTENLRLYVTDFTRKETLKLREDVHKNAFQGDRYENLVKKIQKSFDVSQNKAKFLARQETSLLMTKFKESRYVDAGVMEYRWGCVVGSPGHEVRPMHKRLEGKIFRWDDPPITDDKGSRNNPGQDYNCRCYARPIVRF